LTTIAINGIDFLPKPLLGIDGDVVGISCGEGLLEVGVELCLEGQLFLKVVVDEPAEKAKTRAVLLFGTRLLRLHPLLS
jgi:hypothetical protein